ncbi:MAG: SMP-30/gluconolactonase/LRE family protein [Planctomycetaceae bacterium]
MNPLPRTRSCHLMLCLFLISGASAPLLAEAEPLMLSLQSQRETAIGSGQYQLVTQDEQWQPTETAIIVCDVWDYHHCLNAVRRLEEFAPRLNDVLTKARQQGVTIIHAPSDCMPAYAEHPARKRATQAPRAAMLPHGITSWCSQIPTEEQAVYPLDQSDGGEDDDPAEHADWAKKLTALGRNPNLPWGKQSPLITIDEDRDFITDQGDEVWNVLESRGIKNVILTGVHVNMCVTGRPFGLRQMARNGKHVVLMRDMTDSMYNPQRWPYVSHYAGNDLIIGHIERSICPTMTSAQILGGQPFRFSHDIRTTTERMQQRTSTHQPPPTKEDYAKRWVNVPVPSTALVGDEGVLTGVTGPGWYRCVIYIPADWAAEQLLTVRLGEGTSTQATRGYINGKSLDAPGDHTLTIAPVTINSGDYNLLVLRVADVASALTSAPIIESHDTKRQLQLKGTWQLHLGDDDSLANMPLPAKFGGGSDVVFSPEEPLWVARPLTRKGEFTPGIEGPACDAEGNIFAVNYGKEGTIGRITPEGVGEVFVTLPEGSVGNGIRFDKEGNFYVADYTMHNVLKVNPKTKEITVHAHNDQMNQPNDLAIADDGTLYASDPNWGASTGQLWRIDTDGTTHLLAKEMGTTNGIDISPDGKTLYVNESVQRNVWAFRITPEKTLADKRLVRKFEDHGFDGMRIDVEGNLYISRYGKGTVVKMSPAGKTLQEIDILGPRPSNVCFGGPDGRTVYVTEVESTRITTFRADSVGNSWQQLHPKK